MGPKKPRFAALPPRRQTLGSSAPPGYEPTGNSEAMEGELLYIRSFGSNEKREKKNGPLIGSHGDFFVSFIYLYIVFCGLLMFFQMSNEERTLFRVGDDKLPSYIGTIS